MAVVRILELPGVIPASPAAGSWRVLGHTRDRGVFPQGVTPAWDSWGSSTLNFNLARDPNIPQPDLAAFTPIEWIPDHLGGDHPMWSGYIFPGTPAGPEGMTVNARGWSGALDDKPFFDYYVHEDLSAWQDARSMPGTFLYNGTQGWAANGQVSTGSEITFSWPQGGVVKAQSALGVVLDLGPNSRGAKAVSVDHGAPAGHAVARQMYVKGADQITGAFGGAVAGTFHQGGGPFALNVGNVTNTAVYDRGYRYVIIFLYSAAGGTSTIEEHYKISAIRVFSDDAYRSAGASVLKASQGIARELTRVPVLSQDTGLISATTFSIRAFGDSKASMTPRQRMERFNDYHRWTLRVRPDRRVEFRSRQAAPTLTVNTRHAGVQWADASANDGTDLYNEVVVTGNTGSGEPISVTRTSTNIGVRNLLDRRGRVRSKGLTVNAPTDVAAMTVLADAWLVRFARTPLKGTLTVQGEAIKDINGRGIPASEVGSRVGELVRIGNLIDPDTGNQARDAITVGASYAEDSDVATIAVDNTRDDLDAVLARMQVTGSR